MMVGKIELLGWESDFRMLIFEFLRIYADQSAIASYLVAYLKMQLIHVRMKEALFSETGCVRKDSGNHFFAETERK